MNCTYAGTTGAGNIRVAGRNGHFVISIVLENGISIGRLFITSLLPRPETSAAQKCVRRRYSVSICKARYNASTDGAHESGYSHVKGV